MSSGRVRPPHPSQPPEMRRHTCPELLELRVPYPKIATGLFHEVRNRRVIDVADPWEQVVFDLKVQAANKPRDYSTTPGEVHGRLYLMDCPRVVDAPGNRWGQRKLRLFQAVCHLEHHTQCHTRHQPGDHVVKEDDPDGVEQQRDPESHAEEDHFAGNEDYQLPTRGARERLVTDPAADELAEIINKLPLDGQQPVERPEVEMLPPVIPPPLLMRRQPGEEAEVDVGVMAGDIDVCVMEDDVLPAPQVGAASNQLQRHRHELVAPGEVRIGLMAAVVLNVEPDLGREQPEEDRRLHIHLPTVALPSAGRSEMLCDPPPKLELEGIVVTEREASCRFCGSNGLAGRAHVDLLLVCHRTIPRRRLGALVSEVSTGGVLRGR